MCLFSTENKIHSGLKVPVATLLAFQLNHFLNKNVKICRHSVNCVLHDLCLRHSRGIAITDIETRKGVLISGMAIGRSCFI